jgi:hypothetical protein
VPLSSVRSNGADADDLLERLVGVVVGPEFLVEEMIVVFAFDLIDEHVASEDRLLELNDRAGEHFRAVVPDCDRIANIRRVAAAPVLEIPHPGAGDLRRNVPIDGKAPSLDVLRNGRAACFDRDRIIENSIAECSYVKASKWHD